MALQCLFYSTAPPPHTLQTCFGLYIHQKRLSSKMSKKYLQNKIMIWEVQYRCSHSAVTLQWHNTENSKQIFPEKGTALLQSQFLHSFCERFIYSHDRSAYSAAGRSLTEIWTKAAQFLFWEYINSNFFAVQKRE